MSHHIGKCRYCLAPFGPFFENNGRLICFGCSSGRRDVIKVELDGILKLHDYEVSGLVFFVVLLLARYHKVTDRLV